MMNFYKQQHEFYCGIDLHANSMHVCVVDHDGRKHLHRNFPTKHPRRWLRAMQPYRQRDLVIGCESTFNWYWLADFCQQENLPFLLGPAPVHRFVIRHFTFDVPSRSLTAHPTEQ